MTDRNPSNLGLIEELTDEELLAINGGGKFSDFLERLDKKVDKVTDKVGKYLDKGKKLSEIIKGFKGLFG
jgi:hypothetical protein